jgi:MoaA/NifB/PqqE/SkfB family radical SAM enzyme
METHKQFVQMQPKLLEKIIGGRKIYIWGLSTSGVGTFKALTRNGFIVSGFLEKAKIYRGAYKHGVKVSAPEEVLTDGCSKEIFVIATAGRPTSRAQMRDVLNGFGAKEGVDYVLSADLCNFFPSIDISGACNLKCIACPRGSGDYFHSGSGFISLSDYRAVAEKLLKDMPMLSYVSLFVWGEPLLHPELAEIIKINNELGIPDQISTNLNYVKNLEEIIAAKPAHLTVSCSGYGPEHYEITHTGGSWDKFSSNLHKLSELVKKYGDETVVTLFYHVNRQNVDEYPKIYALGEKLGFAVSIQSSRVFPDYALRYAETGEMTPEAKLSESLSMVSLDEMMTIAKENKAKFCTNGLGFPNINWDKKVFTCCNLGPDDFIADDFLGISLDELIKRRNESDLCRRCIGACVHRYYENKETYEIISKAIDDVMKKSQAENACV